MAGAFLHTCLRVRDIEASVRFYATLGFEERGRLAFDAAYSVFLGLPGDGDRLQLSVEVGRDRPYALGEGSKHFAITVEDLDGMLGRLAAVGARRDKPPYRPAGREDLPRIAFVADPDGYRVELIEGATFPTPQDGRHPSIAG